MSITLNYIIFPAERVLYSLICTVDFWQVAAVIFSMLGQAWGLISYKLACHFAQDNKEIKDLPGLVILFLGHFFGVCKLFTVNYSIQFLYSVNFLLN